jgi:hypothetical protein
MLEHVGRKSGRKRYVVRRSHSQWFRNLEADPQVRIYLASHKPVSAIARRLDTGTSAVSLSRYAAANPRSWAKLRPILEQTLGTPIGESGIELPMIAFDLVGRRTAHPAPDR